MTLGEGVMDLDQVQQPESLSQSVTHMLEECRMVLPGIQALFGFQLIAVFNSTFWEKLVPSERILHFGAIMLVVCSIALVMAPAAYQRHEETRTVSVRFLMLSSRLLFLSMYPLMTGILLDCYLIGRLLLNSWLLSLLTTTILLFAFVFLWILLPRIEVLQRLLSGHR